MADGCATTRVRWWLAFAPTRDIPNEGLLTASVKTTDRPVGVTSVAGFIIVLAVTSYDRTLMQSPERVNALMALATDVSVEDDETKVVNLKIISP